jgi:general secretion pathway protein K
MRRPGFALIAVFWIVMVVGLFTAIVASRSDFNINRSVWAVDMGRVRAAADGAVEEAAFLMIERLSSGAPVAGLAGQVVLDLRIDDIPVHVRIEDEDGKIDLNGAQPELLALLFETLMRENPNLPSQDATGLSERIADFRDPDNLRRVNGAENPEYIAAGLPAGAKNAMFHSVGELGQVLGMTQELAAAAAPYLTVYSGRAQFDPIVSPPGLERLASTVDAVGLLSGLAPSRRRIFAVTAEAALPNGVEAGRAASFRITDDAGQPVVWHGWRSTGD